MIGIVALAFLLTTDDRHVGRIADGRQMIWTAVAISETGGIGQAKARDLTFPRETDSVTRFGMGMSFAQLPAAWLAPKLEERFGAASSQPLFLVAPLIFVLMGATFAALATRELGGGLSAQRLSFLFASIASPLAPYVAVELSEPLQAAALSGAFAASLLAVRNERGSRSAAFLTGLAAGVAVLTKSSLAIVVPLAILPLFAARREVRRHVWGWMAAGAAGPLLAWLAFEIVRFGTVFGGYAGERFSHPWFDGFWRLLLAPNFGLLWVFPAVALVPKAIRSMWPTADARARLGLLSPVLVLSALLALSAGWWAWHGIGPWGPRLLLPAIPLLACPLAIEVARGSVRFGGLLLAVSIGLNLPPVLQHPVPVMDYRAASTWPEARENEKRDLPFFAIRDEAGTVRVYPDHALATESRASNSVVLPWFWWATRGTPDEVVRRLTSPPWLEVRPDVAPPRLNTETVQRIPRLDRWPFLGRGLWPAPAATDYAAVYDEGLANQVLRAQEHGDRELALRLAEKLVALAPSGFHTALLLESHRLLAQRAIAAELLSQRRREERDEPAINVVLALFERDAGNDAGARVLLGTSVHAFPHTAAERALHLPLSEWPKDFASMTSNPALEMKPGR